jgi:phosphoglycerate kinase
VSSFQTIDDLQLSGKIVLLRADLNVPMKDGRVADTTRLVRLHPTLKDLQEAGARIVILSHFGRPKGQKNLEYTLKPVAAALGDILKKPVAFADDCIGPTAKAAIDTLQNGDILVLENTRFYPGEEKNDADFSKELASLGDIFINDAFSAAHRAHASTTALAELMPAAAGRLMQEELSALDKALGNPQKPVAALVGGSKISTKLDLLNNLVAKVDILVLGGGMANTFMAAKGMAIGKSLYEADMLDTAKTIMTKAEQSGCTIMLPTDVVIAREMKENAPHETVKDNAVPANKMIFDIGPVSVAAIKDALSMCKTVIWNGPLGVFEVPPFDKGTNEVAICVSDLSKRGKILSVAGGGDTVSALANAGVTNGISYISTAGGAFLEWMEGKALPGVVALEKSVPAAKKGKIII